MNQFFDMQLFVKDVAIPFFVARVVVSAVARSKTANAVEIFLFKDKVLEVFGDSGRSDALGNDRSATLSSPRDADLSRSLSKLLCNLSNGRIIDSTVLAVNVVAKGRVGGDMDIFLGAEVQQFLLVESRVQFNLKSSRTNTAVIQNVLDLGNVEVGKTNSLYQTSFNKLLHGSPGLERINLFQVDLAIPFQPFR
jgi:hypothetical protein